MKSAPRRSATWWTSAAARELAPARQRLMPPAAAAGFGAMVAISLVLVFPYRSLEEQLAREARKPDGLQTAYLQAWLEVRPDRHRLRYLFARQLLNAGEFALARQQLAALHKSGDGKFAARVLLLDLDVGIAELGTLAEGSPERAGQLQALRARLNRLAATEKTGADGENTETELATRALAVGADVAALLWFERLLDRRARLPAPAWEEAARRVLGLGEAQLAARLFFAAQAASGARGDQRRNFLAALRALQGAGQYALALQEAEARLGALGEDTETLEFLTRLALAANRPDVAQKYAVKLLRISLLPQAIDRLLAHGEPVPAAWIETLARQPLRALPVQADSGSNPSFDPSRTPHLPFDERLYTLSYEVFLANNNLRDALAVALSAVRQLPPQNPQHRLWRLRVAQVADWSGQPALALEQWHALARASNAAADWAEVRKRAQQSFDSARLTDALEFARRRAPDDTALLRQLVAAYEQQGLPERAIALVQASLSTSRTDRKARLELLAQLTERAGRDNVRRDTLRALAREFRTDTEIAVALAQLEYARGDLPAAWAALAPHLKTPPRADTDAGRDFWNTVADLAALTGRRDEAVRAYRALVAAGAADEDDYNNLIAALEESAPLEAAAVAEAAYRRFSRSFFAQQALYLRVRYGAAGETRALLARLSSPADAALLADAQFLAQRASFLLGENDPAGAARDAHRALALAPQAHNTRALLIWALVAARDADALRAALNQGHGIARNEASLWAPWAGGWLALQEPRRALPWLSRQAQRDATWSLALAEALAQLGQTDAAWQLRHRAWRELRAGKSQDAGAQRERDRQLLGLATSFETGDAARQRMQRLTAAKPLGAAHRPDAAARDAVLAYWIARDAAEVAHLWLMRRYEKTLSAPAWAELSVALAENDQPRLTHWLDTATEWLPLADRTEAAVRTGREAQAQTLAFDAAERAPDNDVLHERLWDRLLAAPDSVGAQVERFEQQPLTETRIAVNGALRLTPRWQVGGTLENIDRRSTDGAQLAPLAGGAERERGAALTLRYAPERDGAATLTLNARDGFGSTLGARLDAQTDVLPRLRIGGALGLNQTATNSVFARIGATRDFAQIDTTLRLSQREVVRAEWVLNRFAALNGGRFADGSTARIELRHRLRLDHPELSLRAGLAELRYEPRAGVEPTLLPLLPEPQRGGATNASFLPASTRQASVGLDCGDSARFRPTRAWRPFCSLSLISDQRSGTQTDWLLGARGRVIGGDDLLLSVQGGRALGEQKIPFTLWSVSYRYFY
jgi:hypothetical protein